MKNFLNESRALFVKTLEGISSSADKMANNAKFKAKEMALINNKKELLKNVSDVSYELWLKGVHFPLEIEKILDQVALLDDKLSQLKAEHFAYMNTKSLENVKEEQSSVHPDTENVAQTPTEVDDTEKNQPDDSSFRE